MMSPHRLTHPGHLDRGRRPDPAHGARASTARCDSPSAAMDVPERANANPQAPSPHALHHEPLAYHRALVGVGPSLSQPTSQLGGKPDHGRRGCSRHDSAGAHDVQDYRDQQHPRPRAVPINLAFRLGNRSNGAPLATIIEQGSYSTLDSKGSILNVGRFSSLRVVENVSPRCALPMLPPRSSEHALQLNTQGAQREQASSPTTRAQCKPSYKDIGSLSPLDKATIPSLRFILDRPQNIQYQPGEIACNRNSKNVKALVRGLLHHVRAGSRTGSKSSSTHTSVAECRENQLEQTKHVPKGQVLPSETFDSDNNRLSTPPGELIEPLGVIQLSALERQSRDARTLTADCAPSARLDFPLSEGLERPLSLRVQPVVTPPSSKPATLTPAYQQPCSVHLVGPESRPGSQERCCIESCELPAHNRNSTLNKSAFYSVSASSNATLSLSEIDRARDASQNASFCSTVSTSYSGTVVGIDVDLQHEFTHTVRHSCSSTSVAPVWFTPRTTELGQQAPASASSAAKQAQEAELSRHCISSAALATLLPIAAASGIVRPNYETPKISFFSPSGNLIQPEDCSTPSTVSASSSSNSPVMVPKFSKPNPAPYNIFPVTCLPPPRPSLRPMTTPPTTSVPLPPNLRHHHNYKRPEKSQINSETEGVHSFIEPGPTVKGCDGIVRTNTLPAYAQTHRSYGKTKTWPQYRRNRSSGSFRKEIRLGIRSHKARWITAITTSCTTKGKERLLCKQNAATKHASMPHKRKRACAAMSDRKRICTRHASRKHNTELLGPVAGHILRVCFCQPYDSAGKPTHNVFAKTFCMGDYASDMHEKPNKESLPIDALHGGVVDAVLPNARVVTGVNRKINIINSTRKRMSTRREQGSLTTKL